MDPTAAILLATIAGVALAVFAYQLAGFTALRLRLHRRRLIVVLKTGQTFRGVLWRQPHRHLELRNAELLENDTAIRIDGAVLVARTDVLWLQHPERGN